MGGSKKDEEEEDRIRKRWKIRWFCKEKKAYEVLRSLVGSEKYIRDRAQDSIVRILITPTTLLLKLNN